MKQRNIRLWAAAIGMIILILDSRAILFAAQDAIQLCIRTLIPSLMPFFIFSSLLTGSLSGRSIALLSPLEKICRIPKGSGTLLIIGMLGGYPAGARCIREAVDCGQLSRQDARRMLAFCNNCGPSFLFGIIAPLFPDARYAWILWLIHIFGAVFTAFLIPGSSDTLYSSGSDHETTLSDALESALRTTAIVCGWVIFFRLVISFLERWLLWRFPVFIQVLISGILELSNGCIGLDRISSVEDRLLLCSAITAFGGLCVSMQTRSVCGDLSLKYYFPGKLIHAGISFVLALNYLAFSSHSFIPLTATILLTADLIIAYCILSGFRGKNVVAFLGKMMYNLCNTQK